MDLKGLQQNKISLGNESRFDSSGRVAVLKETASHQVHNRMKKIIEMDFEMDFLVSDPESWIYGKILNVLIIGILLEIVSNGLLYGIFIYEKYGIDSQRRTMTNMFFSQICIACILLNILAYPFYLYGLYFSPNGIGYPLALWTVFFMTFLLCFIGFSMTQIMILKCLYLTNWPMMALLDDNFFATFVGLSNITISILFSSIRLGMGEFVSHVMFQKMSGGVIIKEKTRLKSTAEP